MIAGQLKDWRKHPGFAQHNVWTEAFEWIEKHAATSEEGIFPLKSEGCYVRVMSYGLKTREEANFESHLKTIDLQYTIKGGEGIECCPLEQLTPKGDYLEEKDFQFYETPEFGSAFVKNFENHFCVLFPEDGHQPQRFVEGHEEVRKLVVKIPRVMVL